MVQSAENDDLNLLVAVLPPRFRDGLRIQPSETLLEIVLDLGRPPRARYVEAEEALSASEVTTEDIEHVVARVGEFGDDNRAGIERTLHRISAIRNRKGRIVGLTLRVGRAVYGTIKIIRDIVESGQSILLLGRPGVGKTTMLREVARVLADEFHKRVIVVDTSNEIAGDGDIPHPGIGGARRMQVATPNAQHGVMIEAVENHMPEVIVIDEIGTELEAHAARTIAERGVQLVGTAHGNTLENLMQNPTLSDLIGGIQSVTLSDEEARRRGTQKSILERKAPPTFDAIVEIQSWDRVAVHANVAETVDALLRAQPHRAQNRWVQDGVIAHSEVPIRPASRPNGRDRTVIPFAEYETVERLEPVASDIRRIHIYPYGVSNSRLEQTIDQLRAPAEVVRDPRTANLVMTLKSYYKRRPPAIKDAESAGVQIYILKSNTAAQMQQCLAEVLDLRVAKDPVSSAVQEAEDAIKLVMSRSESIALNPQNAYVRRLQHQIAERYNLGSRSEGREPYRRVKILP
ncbi:MAG: AAA family ATPase [Chloroflexi bacterium]|nr:AAA family ATPase [Chloroflexota bacterium]